MAAASETASAGPGEMACPDPSVHQHHHKLSEQASTAALYVTNHPARPPHPGRDSRGESESENPLGPDGKLSSKSAATSLRHAKPQDLPSFPSTGGLTADNAGKAALLAQDYKMKELWQPEQSLAGSRAALVAQKKGGKLHLWEASQSKEGLSAAQLAVGNKTTVNAYGGVDAENKSKALQAATMSVNKGRSRATSTPQPAYPEYPDSQNATANALGAATASHRASKLGAAGWDDQANQAARIGNLHNPVRGQFTDHVDYDPDPDDTKHQAALKASAISMAQGIFQNQDRRKLIDDPSNANLAGAQAAARRSGSATAQADLKQQAMQYISLQDAARKLAAERLAKIDKDAENARYREYYGYGDDKSKRLSSRLSMRSVGSGRQRKRASSDGGRNLSDDSDDEVQAQRIRTQMAQLSTATGKVDQRKQQDDRAKLLAAAEKRVSARLHTMDEKVLADTGKVPPSLMEDWEAKARERAQKQREEAASHPGKTHVGGGKFMADADIEAIAAARLKPTLDQLNANAENRRAKEEELRLEKEEQDKEKRDEKQKVKEEKERVKRLVAEEKAAEKARKDGEKARKAEEKRLEKEGKRKSREHKRDTVVVAPTSLDATRTNDDDENAVEDPAVTKHRSALGRLKNRFSKINKESDTADTEVERVETADVKEERPGTAASITAVAGGIPGNTTSGGTETDASVSPISPADEASVVQPQPLRPHETERSAVLDHKDSPAPAAMPIAPLTVPEHDAPLTAQSTTSDQGTSGGADTFHPAVVPSAAGVTAATVPALVLNGNEAGADASQSAPKRPEFGEHGALSYREESEATHLDSHMPDLERHISAIPDSDDSDDEWDSDDERSPRTTGAAAVPSSKAGVAEHDHSKAAIGAGVGAGAGVATGALGEEKAQVIADRVQAAPVTNGTTQSPVSPVEPPTQRAVEPTSTTVHSPTTTTSTTTTTTQHQAPAVTSAAHHETAAASSTAPADTAELRTSIDEAVAHVAKTKFGTVDDKPSATTLGTAVSGQPKEAIGPDPKPAKLQKSGGPVEGVGTTVNTSVDSGKLHKDQKHSGESKSSAKQEKEGKGFRGFFNKLRNKESKGENKYPEFKSPERGESSKHVSYESTKAGEKPITTGTTSGVIGSGAEGASATKTADTAPTLANVDTGPTFSTVNEPDSPSSYQRGATGLADLDDESSGAEEDDIARGRAGRSTAGKKIGFGSSRTSGKATAADRQNSSTEDETFEEARDHFDESLAPPPAFAGQAKSESPSRGTRFQEQL